MLSMCVRIISVHYQVVICEKGKLRRACHTQYIFRLELVQLLHFAV